MRRVTDSEGGYRWKPSPILDVYELQDENGNTPLMRAVINGDWGYVAFMFERRIYGYGNFVPVYKKMYNSSGEVIRSTSSFELYIHRINNEGLTAMMLAAVNCNHRIFELFKRYSSPPRLDFSHDVSIIEGEVVTPYTLWHENCSEE